MSNKFSRKAAFAMPMAALALAASSAFAAPVVGPSGPSFYTNPASLPDGVHGDLISYRVATVNLGAGAPAVKAWNVLYRSQDAVDFDTAVSGTVFVPTAAWAGTGPRPVILYGVGTHGLGKQCAPSRQFETGKDYENANINAALAAGYAVLVSDYEGYLEGSTPTYIVGKSQGRAILDIFKAATQIPNSGVSATAPVGIWGYSQGGQTAAWAGEQLATYAPAIKAIGVAAGGTPADLYKVAPRLDADIGFAFLGMTLSGLSTQYPEELPANLILTDAGEAELAKLNDQCIFKSLFAYQNDKTSNYTIGAKNINDLINTSLVRKVLDKQLLGTTKINVPVYQYHGRADQFIPFPQHLDLKKAYCAKGTVVHFDMYPGEHIITQFQSGPTLAFFADRLAGKTPVNTCSTTTVPTSTANPGGGDLVVSLTNWTLDAKVRLKLLNQDLPLPADSKLTAISNITAKTLTGSLTIPKFTQKVNIIGLKVPVSLTITPAGGITGTNSLDDEGILRINGNAPVDIVITSLAYIPFGQCKTITPAQFPINFTGPVSALGSGKLTFTGTTTFPKIDGCGIKGTLSALMSGSGQGYTFTAVPPAPVKN